MDELLRGRGHAIQGCLFRHHDGDTARLKPAAHPGNEAITVSLTIDAPGMESRDAVTEKDKGEEREGGEESPFTAVWGYGSDRLTFDMGRCALR